MQDWILPPSLAFIRLDCLICKPHQRGLIMPAIIQMTQLREIGQWVRLTFPHPSPLAWVALAIVLMIDGIWIYFGGYQILPSSLINLSLGAICIIMLMGFILYGRGRDDLQGIVNWASAMLFAIPFSIASVILSYLAVTTNLPLVDTHLAAFDQALGFNWLGLMDFANYHTTFGHLTSTIYRTTFAELALIVLFLGLTKRAKAMRELIDVYWITLLLMILFSVFFPAVGPFAHYTPSLDRFPVVQPTAGMVFLPDYLALRAGTFHTFNFGAMQGIIEFPSFHAALALMMTWALRQTPRLLIVGCIYNGLMLFATLTEGGHYLSDVIVGSLIVCATIVLRHRLTRSKETARMTRPLQALRGFD